MTRNKTILVSATCLSAALVASESPAGRVVVAHDEWTLSNTGFTSPSDPGIFALNVVAFLTGRQSANILVYSSNFGVTQAMFLNTLGGAGHAVTVSTAVPFTLPSLLNYDAIFITGVDFDDQVLSDYVDAGGGVYICAGTGNSTDLANNTFMAHIGLQFGPLNGLGGHFPISSPHPIFSGVDHLYHLNGSAITDLDPSSGAQVLVTAPGDVGLYAAYDGAGCPGPTADINGDGSVSGADLGLLLAGWGDCAGSCCAADLSGDGVVNGADLGLLLAAWTG